MAVRVCFKVPGEDITVHVDTIVELAKLLRTGYTMSCIAHIWLNGKKFHFGGI